jgi:hypothetical protein
MNFKQYLVVFTFVSLITLPAMSGEIVSWNNTEASDFSARQCITIPGTPGTPKKCAPSFTQKYPCPTFKHPKKKCKHTVGGPCSPAIPGTPSVSKCGNVNFGKFSISVDGGVYTEFDGIGDSEVAVQTTVNVSMFGKSATLPVTCKISIGKKVSICLNLLTRTFAKSSDSGYSCEIAGADVASISYPGVTANLCMDVTVGGVAKGPSGTLGAHVEADIQFGKVNVGGHSISMGNKGWNPTLFSVKF